MEHKTYIECGCRDQRHRIVFVFDDDCSTPYDDISGLDMFLQVHLNPGTLWQRIKRAYFYVIGRGSQSWGEFEDVIIPSNSVDELHALLSKYIETRNKYEEQNDDS